MNNNVRGIKQYSSGEVITLTIILCHQGIDLVSHKVEYIVVFVVLVELLKTASNK